MGAVEQRGLLVAGHDQAPVEGVDNALHHLLIGQESASLAVLHPGEVKVAAEHLPGLRVLEEAEERLGLDRFRLSG